MICPEGKVSLHNFLAVSVIFCILFQTNAVFSLSKVWGVAIWGPVLYFSIFNVVIRLFYRENDYQIAVRSASLGFIFMIGVYVKQICPVHIQVFGIYMCTMSMFHYSEFFVTAIIQPKLVSTDSFVINHSPQYTVAAVSSWIEFAVEAYFFPGQKSIFWISNIGLAICLAGECLRKLAMLTAGSNFNHLVQCEKLEGHTLVTHGVYSWFRHPSYVGWFYWSIGTQIVALNPVCLILYAIASWCFFKERILIEEITLLNFFGQQYCDYQEAVGTGLPFIKGYVIKP